MFFEEEYRKIIEQLKKNEDYAVMCTICEDIIGLLEENGVKVEGTIIRDTTSTKTMRVVNNFEVKFRGLDFTEHDKRYADEISALKKQIYELESELEHSKEYTKSLRGMLGLRSAKENIELANKLYEFNFEVPDEKEPLPFSDEEDRIDELEKRIEHLEDWLAEEKERKIKELEAEQALLMSEIAHSSFISNLVRPLKP